MKKILSLILVLSILCSFPVITHSEDVADASDDEAVETLVALGIIEGSGGDLMLDKVLTRAEFVTMLMRVMNSEYQNDSMYFEDVPKSHWAFADISTACMMGIVQGNEEKKFQPDKPVVYEEMVKMLVCALGYGTYASLKGGYPAGYMAVAQQKDLLDNALGRQGLIVKRRLAAQMIFNALDVPLMQENGFGEYIEAELDASKTLLSQNMKIRKGEGIVKANSVTSLAQSGGVSDGLVQIGNKTFREGVSNAFWQLGYTVTYYADISETEDTPPLIYSRIAEKKNEVITALERDIADNCTKSEFKYQSGGKSRKFSIDLYADLIYNGVSTGGFTPADLKPASGSVTLIDNDNDNDADVILVRDYTTIIVGSYNTASYMAYDRDDVNKFIELDPESDDYNCIIYENKEECRFSLVRENSVLSVAKSKNLTGKKSIKVMLSNESVSGVFEAVDTTDNIAVIDGVEYRMLSGVYAKIKDYMGQSITLYLDAFGNIAGADDRIISKFSYGYLIEAATKGSVSQQSQFKILTETGDVEIINGAKKISLDANSAISGNEIPSKLAVTVRSGGTGKEQLIRYRLNQNGEINAIDTVATGKGGDADSLSKDVNYKGGDNASDKRRYIANLFGYEKAEFAVNDNVLVFAIPKPAEKSEDTKYNVYGKSYFVQNEYYELEAYDLEDDMTVAACIIQDAAVEEVSDLARIVIVDKISVAIIDGEEIHKLSGYHQGQKMDFYAKDQNVFLSDATNTLYKRGDIVLLAADKRGDVANAVDVMTDIVQDNGAMNSFKGTNPFNKGSNDTTFFASIRVNYTYPMNLKDNTFVVQSNPADGLTRYPYVFYNKTQYYIYEAETDELRLSSKEEVAENLYGRNSSARVAVASAGGAPLDVIIYDFEK